MESIIIPRDIANEIQKNGGLEESTVFEYEFTGIKVIENCIVPIIFITIKDKKGIKWRFEKS